MKTMDEILEIARHWLRRPPSPRDYENGAVQEDVADVMHWVVDTIPAIVEEQNEFRG